MVEFYSKLNPDPWSEAHEELEMKLNLIPLGPTYAEDIVAPINMFVNTLEDLALKYKPFSVGVQSHPIISGFYSSTRVEVDSRDSVQKKRCGLCGSKENIGARKDGTTGKAMIMCEDCWVGSKGQNDRIK